MIVADTTLIVPFLVPHARSTVAATCRERDDDWIAPPSARAETLNVVYDMLRRGEVDLRTAEEGMRRFEDVVRLVPYRDAVEVLRLALKHRLSGYDAEFAAVASFHGLRVVTDDRQLRERAPSRSAVLLSEFAAGR